MSAFMVNTNVMAKVVTAILLNLTRSTERAPAGRQCLLRRQMRKKLFLMNRRALSARYGLGDHFRVPEFIFETWADASPVSQFKAISCLLCQCSEGKVPNSPLSDELNRAAGELAQAIVQELPEYDQASWGD